MVFQTDENNPLLKTEFTCSDEDNKKVSNAKSSAQDPDPRSKISTNNCKNFFTPKTQI